MDEKGLLRPKLLLRTAYDAVISNPRIIAGGSTASLAVLDGSGSMEAANLGDSAFLILGPGKVAYRSSIQTHAFNTPYQLSKVPAKMMAQHRIFGGGQHFSEVPDQADVTRHQVRHGDIVVFATDGVWDNLSAQDTFGIVTRVMEEGGYWANPAKRKSVESILNSSLISSLPKEIKPEDAETYLPGLLATAIMREAKIAGLDRRRDGPFAKEVNSHFPEEGWSGGKPDDIAVVVCVAVDGAVEAASEHEQKPIKAKL
jgi:protein phosphatase PTC7